MHDIERKPAQDDATVKITDLPRQEDQQVAPESDSMMSREPTRPRQPFARRSLAAGGVLLLVFTIKFSMVLLRGQSSSQPGPGRAPAQTQPTSQPSPTATPVR